MLYFFYVNLTITMNPLSSKAHSLAQTRQTKHRTNRTENQHERATKRIWRFWRPSFAHAQSFFSSVSLPSLILVPRGRAPFGQHQDTLSTLYPAQTWPRKFKMATLLFRPSNRLRAGQNTDFRICIFCTFAVLFFVWLSHGGNGLL